MNRSSDGKRALINGAPCTGGGVARPSQADGLPSARGCPAMAALSAADPATVDASPWTSCAADAFFRAASAIS